MKPLQVGRPSQMPQAQACIDEIMNEAKEYNRWVELCKTWKLPFSNTFASRLYLASIHRDLTEEDIRSVFSAFGTIKECDMSKYASIFENQHSCVKSRLEHFLYICTLENKLKFFASTYFSQVSSWYGAAKV